jgi:hypothetical protein
MRKYSWLCLPFLLLASACSPTSATPPPVNLRVEYTFAAQPWLSNLYACSGGATLQAEPRAADYFDFPNLDLAIRIGAPASLPFPAYQIDQEQVLVIVNHQNPIQALTAAQVLDLFTGRLPTWQSINGNQAPVQVWVFAHGEDLQQVFEQTALGGAPVTSLARLATGPDEMAQAVAGDVNAVGLLTRLWLTGNVSDVFTAAVVPVLLLTPETPEGPSADLIACLQK